MKYLLLLILLGGCAELKSRAEERIMGQKPAVIRIDEEVRRIVPKEEVEWHIFKWGVKVKIPVSF